MIAIFVRPSQNLNVGPFVFFLSLLFANLGLAKEFEFDADKLRASFQESLKTSAFRPKFDFKAFDFLEALVEQRENRKWLNLFRLIDDQLDDVRNQMIPTGEGMWMTVGQWCDQLLRDLPPEGLDKIRLYVDSRARQALNEIETTTSVDELYRMYDRFSMSSHGHHFADHLGDALFESGNYHDAVIVWNKALLYHDAMEVSELRVMVKRAVALSRMNSPTRLRHVCDQLIERFGNQTTTIGGQKRSINEFATTLSDSVVPSARDHRRLAFRPDDIDTWAWSVYWPELEEAGKKTIPISYSGNDEFSVVHVGYAAAGFDRQTAKLTWIHQFGTAYSPSSRNTNSAFLLRGLQRGRRGRSTFAIPAPASTPVPVATKDRFILRMYRTETDQGVPSGIWTMRCLAADSGKLLWTSEGSLPEQQVAADPVALHGEVFVVCTPKTSNQLRLNVLDEITGRLKWSLPLGSVDLMTSSMSADRAIRLTASGDRLYVVAGGEVAMSVNTRQRSINWLYQVKRKTSTNPSDRQIVLNGRIAVIRGRQIIYGDSSHGSKPLSTIVDNLQVFLLDPELESLTCIDEDTRELRWRQDEINGQLVGVDSRNVYVYDANKKLLIAIERETGKLSWEQAMKRTSIDNITSIGDEVFVPHGNSLLVMNRNTGESRQIKAIPEAGEIQRIIRDQEYAVAISRDYVTVFLLTEFPPTENSQ